MVLKNFFTLALFTFVFSSAIYDFPFLYATVGEILRRLLILSEDVGTLLTHHY